MLDKCRLTWPNVNTRPVITTFSGVRAHPDTDDFIIGPVHGAPEGAFEAIGIESPGLSAAPAIGEELGYVGCIFVLVLMALIIGRCIYVGLRSTDYMRKLICFGAASALIFQVMINVGMCIGVMPVIGLTLPFISYGGSSILSLYAMLGLVSGVYARPKATSHERYIRPPL